jgi:hypothetical protein
MLDVVAAANLLVCITIVWTCLCRLRTDLCRLNLLPRFKYSVLLTGGLVAGLPNLFFGEEASKSTLVLSTSILVYLVSNAVSWKGKE